MTALALIAVGAAVGSLGFATNDDEKLSHVEDTLVPRSRDWALDSIAWIPGGHLAMGKVDASTELGSTIVLVHLTDAEPTWRNLRDLASFSCRDPDVLLFPVAVGRERFAFVEGCLEGIKSAPRSKHLREFSLRSNETVSLYDYGLPYPAGAFALETRGPRGVLNDGTGLEEQLRWLKERGLSEPIPLGLDRVGDPVWSPTEDLIALSGVSGISSIEGVARAERSRWRLYFGDAGLTTLATIAGVEYRDRPFLAWSADGRLLAVSGQTGDSEGDLKLLRPGEGDFVVVRSAPFGAVTWIDDSTVAVVRHANYAGEGDDVVEILDVSKGRDRLESEG